MIGALAFRASSCACRNEGKAAEETAETMENKPSCMKFSYEDEMSLEEKIEAVVKRVYGGDGIAIDGSDNRVFSNKAAGEALGMDGIHNNAVFVKYKRKYIRPFFIF